MNRLLEAIASPSNHPAVVGKHRPMQIADRASWSAVPDDQNILAAMTIIHTVPCGSSTITQVNPTDPGTDFDPARTWLARPGHNGRLFRSGRR